MGSGASQSAPPTRQPTVVAATPPYPYQTTPYAEHHPPSYANLNSNSRTATNPNAQSAYPTTQPPYPTTQPPYPTTQPPYPTTQPPYPTAQAYPITYPTHSATQPPYPVAQQRPATTLAAVIDTPTTHLPSTGDMLIEHSPPPSPPPTHSNSAATSTQHDQSDDDDDDENDFQTQACLLQSYGEQDYDLNEMTLPNASYDVLLTDRDIREADDFIAEMEEKRNHLTTSVILGTDSITNTCLYELIQTELWTKLRIQALTDDREISDTCELITSLCQLHHFLYGGSEDELGIEFVPAENAREDDYILEQLESLTRRHHQELKKSDKLCAQKLLEGRGATMTEQKLDSILEEHIKLRSYMRTRQTRDQIAAYHQVQLSIRENPSLYQLSRQTAGQAKTSQVVTAVAAHPIVTRLPPISQSKLRAIGATRGRTEVVDQAGNVTRIPSAVVRSQAMDEQADDSATTRARDNTKLNPSSGRPRVGQSMSNNINTGSIWTRAPSEDPEEEEVSPSQPPSAMRWAGDSSEESDENPPTTVSSIPKEQPQLAAVTSDSRHIATGSEHLITAPERQEVAEPENNLLRTGVVPGSVSNRITQFTSTATEERYDSPKESPNIDRRTFTDSADTADYDEDFEEDEDLVAQYQRTMKVDNYDSSSEDSASVTSDRNSSKTPVASDSESEHGSGDDEQSKLIASANLKNDLSDAIWEHQSEINPQSFHELISMWQSRQKNIAERKEIDADAHSTGRAMWQKVKEKLVYKAIAGASAGDDSDEETTHSVGQGVSTSMQTSMTAGRNMSVQTDAMMVDAETLVDEFLIDDHEKKKIKKMDKELVEKLVNGELTDEEYCKLLQNNQNNIDKLRKQREVDRLKALKLLEETKAKRNQRDEWNSDEETNQKLLKIEQRVTNKLIKHKDKIGERDMKNLLNEARRQQEEILRQRAIERLRQNENMKEKLIERRRAKMEAEEKKKMTKSEVTDLEDQFYNDLKSKLASGHLTHEQFKALIDEHLSKMSGAEGLTTPPRKNQYDISEPKDKHTIEAVQNIIRKGHEKNKAIQNVRQRERQNALTELKQKRKNKKKKAMVE